eukprot:CAMPEP_0170882916 /NCGR_PEP_ID=MMETSP0734-20130129/33984_1 /TAXON_ID=186038 /ORGANISM="Fragilariopsis kerguelensis, Strain L26-C5" /LENGTH=385 /DNA_ID=CAMNT_0011267059 /DNA_START=30 /DNA_END=1183 /DNA_ORIENTATION=-
MNKKEKEKESDGSTGNVNGGSSSNNNNNNNITIPTTGMGTTTTTTTIVLTKEEIETLDNIFMLTGYPKSNDFLVGYRLLRSDQQDPAIASFIRGAKNDGCVPCMFVYGYIQRKRGNFYLVIPIALEGAIRGHMPCMDILMDCYQEARPVKPMALSSFWMKTKIEFGDNEHTEDDRKKIKKTNANICVSCGREKSEGNDVTLVKCGICKHYAYCGKKCQTHHWKEGKHMPECRQVIILRKYCKPSYIKEIREAIIAGQDPKEIHTLQRLRMKLGLNRPKEEYEELLLHLDDNNNNINNIIKPGTKVKVKGLVKASAHNGKIGIVISSKDCRSSITGEEHRRVVLKLPDNNGGTVDVAIKIINLELSYKYECLIGRKDGTVHIGSTP